MAPEKKRAGRSLVDQLADLEDPTPKGTTCGLAGLKRHLLRSKRLTLMLDFDPEDLDRAAESSDEEAGKQSDVNVGREHYQAVGLV